MVSVFILLHNHHFHHLCREFFSSCASETLCPLSNNSYCPTTQTLATTIPLFVSISNSFKQEGLKTGWHGPTRDYAQFLELFFLENPICCLQIENSYWSSPLKPVTFLEHRVHILVNKIQGENIHSLVIPWFQLGPILSWAVHLRRKNALPPGGEWRN